MRCDNIVEKIPSSQSTEPRQLIGFRSDEATDSRKRQNNCAEPEGVQRECPSNQLPRKLHWDE